MSDYIKCICIKDISWLCYTNTIFNFKIGEQYKYVIGYQDNYYITQRINNQDITSDFPINVFDKHFINTRDYNLDILIND